jgi:peptidoglycan/LPS O-acetylase OafA/YrhL
MAKRVVPITKAEATDISTLVGSEKAPVAKVPVKVMKSTDGAVTTRQKIAGYYKAVVALVGALLTIVSQIQDLTPFLPSDAATRHWIGFAFVALTTAATALKENQHWVEDDQVA